MCDQRRPPVLDNLPAVTQLVIAGWAGRNAQALEDHIRELEALGVARPKSTPVFYRASPQNLTSDPSIQVVGRHSTGEVECVFYWLGGEVWVGVGSDHTDRSLEAHSVTLSKQVCAKPVSRDLWRHDEVVGHFDRLVLRSWATRSGVRSLYQEGETSSLLSPLDLASRCWGSAGPPDGTAMFCGTLGVHGDIAFAELFEVELYDPVRDRALRHAYTVVPLPVEG